MGWLRSGGVYLASLVVGMFFGHSVASFFNIASGNVVIGSGVLTIVLVYYTRNNPGLRDLPRPTRKQLAIIAGILLLLVGSSLLLHRDTGPEPGRAYYVYSDNTVPSLRFGYHNFTAARNFTVTWDADRPIEISLWRTAEFLNATRNGTELDYIARRTQKSGNITYSPGNLTQFTVGVYNPFTVENHVELEIYLTNSSATMAR